MLKTAGITLDSKIVQKEGNIVSDMDGEKVMLNIQNGKYYNLGTLGGEIWSLINEPIILNQLVLKLMEDYEVKKQECENQILAFLTSLQQEDLIEIIE
jgi:hypothetical protein